MARPPRRSKNGPGGTASSGVGGSGGRSSSSAGRARSRDEGRRGPPGQAGTERSFRNPTTDDRDQHADRHAHHTAQHAAHHPDDRLVRISGLPSVAELFNLAAERVERLYFDTENKAAAQPFCAVLARRRKVYRQVGADEMRRVAGTAMHGGIVALARPRQVPLLDIDAARTWAAAGASLLILDGVGNPQNIGAIARTASFFGVERMVLSDHPSQAGLSDASHRVAKGGLERIEIYRAERLPEVLQRLSAFYHVVATVAERGKSLAEIERGKKPIALILGNEEDGIAPATLAACSAQLTLRGRGRVQSLNVSATAAILIHALLAKG